MAQLSKRYGTSAQKEAEGVWVSLGDGIRVKVARANNPAHMKITERLIKPFRRQIQNNSISMDKTNELTIKAMSLGILKDWEGIEDEKGKPIPYSEEMAEIILTEYKDFREEISRFRSQWKCIARKKSRKSKKLIDCLSWELTWAEHREAIQKAEDKGASHPALKNKPTLFPDLGSVWAAWSTLNTTRSYSGGMAPFPLPIRFNDIVFYMEYYDIDDPHRFISLIQALDGRYIQHQIDKQKVKKPPNSGDSKTERFHG